MGTIKSITWEGRSCNGFPTEGSSRGFIIYGNKGTLVNYGNDDFKIHDYDNKPIKEVKSVTEGHKSILLCHLANIAQRTGRAFHGNPLNSHTLNDADAMKLLQREYEKGKDGDRNSKIKGQSFNDCIFYFFKNK